MMLRTRLEKLERAIAPPVRKLKRVFSVGGLNFSDDDVTAFLAANGISRQPDDMVICFTGMPTPETEREPMSIGWFGRPPAEARA